MKIQHSQNIYFYNTSQNNRSYASNVAFKADIFNKKALKAAQDALEKTSAENEILQNQCKNLESLLSTLKKELGDISSAVSSKKTLSEKAEELQTQLKGVLARLENTNEIKALEDYKQRILKKLDSPLSYNPLNPVYKDVEPRTYNFSEFFDYRKLEQSGHAVRITPSAELLGRLNKEGKLVIDFPKNNAQRFLKDKKAFLQGENIYGLNQTINTDMTAIYGKRVNWSDEKISRDIFQNFYDAHGHTLEGTNIDISKTGGTYKVKISGQSQYDHKNIQYIGSGNKDNDLYNAGGFGEGTKILSAVLLGTEKTKNVRFASANWTIDFSRTEEAIKDSVITRTLKKLEKPIDGNYIEFETKDAKLVEKILEARNYFYHPKNPDFKNLTFENDSWGFKLLPEKEKGNLYLTQRFEYQKSGQWDNGVEDVTIIFKRRPKNSELFDKNRDRINLSIDEIKNLIKEDFAKTMSDEDLMDSILKLEPLWNNSLRYTQEGAGDELCKSLVYEAFDRNLGINFGEKKFAARSFFCYDIEPTVENLGYELCSNYMERLGMRRVRDIYAMTRKHAPLPPTEIEKKKLMLLEEGISLLADDSVMQKRISLADAKKPRFIFNAKQAKEEGTNAESVTKSGEYLGHWVDREYLNSKDFYTLLGTWLHEITHKYSGDGTKDFGYKLTDVMGMELESLMNKPEKAEKLKVLRDIFNSLS